MRRVITASRWKIRGMSRTGLNTNTDQDFVSDLVRDFPYLEAPALVIWASAQLEDLPVG